LSARGGVVFYPDHRDPRDFEGLSSAQQQGAAAGAV